MKRVKAQKAACWKQRRTNQAKDGKLAVKAEHRIDPTRVELKRLAVVAAGRAEQQMDPPSFKISAADVAPRVAVVAVGMAEQQMDPTHIELVKVAVEAGRKG